jgi:hypothetical protein
MKRPLLASFALLTTACSEATAIDLHIPQDTQGFEQPIEGGWSIVADLGNPSILSLWAAADDDLWLAGGYPPVIDPGFTPGPDPDPVARLAHYDGHAWQDVESPSSSMLTQVWGSSATDVWVLDVLGKVFHFDGRSWSAMPELSGDAIGGTAADDVWLAQRGTLVHWDGRQQATFVSPARDIIIAIYAFSPDDVWAGGGGGTLIHWDGNAWSDRSPGSTLYNVALWGAAADDFWAVGNGGNRLHWDGQMLDTQAQDYTGFEGIAGRSSKDIWGVGSCCWDDDKRELAWASHFDGKRWNDVKLKSLTGTLQAATVTPEKTLYAISSEGELIINRP